MSETNKSTNETESTAKDPFSVARVASLAKLDPENNDQVQTQMQRILGFVAVLQELKLDDVEPFFGATNFRSANEDRSASQPIRQDEPTESLPRDQALKNSPIPDSEFYIVPPVFD